MRLIEFMESFPDEASCKHAFKVMRDKEGVVCRKCKHKEHYYLKTVSHFKCKKCGCRTTLRSGTVMQHAKLSFRHWFIAMHLISATKKGFSALEIQRQLNHKYYRPIWYMLHKLRRTMGERDDKHQLEGLIEVDEAMVTVHPGDQAKTKRGRGSEGKSIVLVLAQTKYVKNKKNEEVKVCQYVKMKCVNSFSAVDLQTEMVMSIKEESKIQTDGNPSYNGCEMFFKKHIAKVLKASEIGKFLPVVHINISNVKRKILDIHHCVRPQYLQNYLNEFCYKQNRIPSGVNIFDRLLIASVTGWSKCLVHLSD